MDGVRITARPSTTQGEDAIISSGSLDEKLAEQQPASKPNTAAHTGGVRYKAQVGVNGEITVTKNVATGSVKAEPRPGATAMDSILGPVSIERAKADSVITIPGYGDSSAAAFEQMGLLKRLPTGGYALDGEAAKRPAAAPAAPVAQEQAPALAPDVAADAMRDVRGLSPESDAVLAKLTSASPITVESMIETAARGGEVDFQTIGKSMNDEGAAARLEQAVTETRNAGICVLTNLGVDPVAFEAHIRATNPELASTITRDMFSNRSTESLIRAAQTFKADRAQRIAQIANAKNVPATVKGGVVFFERASLGLSPYSGSGDFRTSEISEAEARRLGVLDVTERQ